MRKLYIFFWTFLFGFSLLQGNQVTRVGGLNLYLMTKNKGYFSYKTIFFDYRFLSGSFDFVNFVFNFGANYFITVLNTPQVPIEPRENDNNNDINKDKGGRNMYAACPLVGIILVVPISKLSCFLQNLRNLQENVINGYVIFYVITVV